FFFSSRRRHTRSKRDWSSDVCSSDLQFSEGPVDEEEENYWMPVDMYVGGAEHSVLHLLYARFWHKVLYDCGIVSTKEPFQRLVRSEERRVGKEVTSGCTAEHSSERNN